MKIETVSISSIKPNPNNAKEHPDWQLQQVAESIKRFGDNDPIAVDGEGMIIEGHGRWLAKKDILGHNEAQIIRLTHMTEEEKRAYTLVHNQLTMNTGFDMEKLEAELEALSTLDVSDLDMSDLEEELEKMDMSAFGFDSPHKISSGDEEETSAGENQPDSSEQQEDGGYYGDERERTYSRYHLDEFEPEEAEGFYQMPQLMPCRIVPDQLIGFNYVLSAGEEDHDKGVHFYLDDYQFERVWVRPYFYIEKLKDFRCVLTPDFSLYLDMPMAMKIWNIYRSRLFGQMMQREGIEVIPTVSWAEAATFEFCFDGLPKHSYLSVSTIGVKRDEEAMSLWKAGMDEMIRRCEPEGLIIYGGNIDYDFKGIDVRFIETRKGWQ